MKVTLIIKTNYKILSFLIILLLTHSCKTIDIKENYTQVPLNRIIIEENIWKIYLQPFTNANIFINNKKISYQEISHDKTLGFISFKIPIYNDAFGFHLKISLNGYNDLNQQVLLQTKHKNWLKEAPTFVLNTNNSLHTFINYIKVGKQPKSVTFIDNLHVSLPLLDDVGIDIVNIKTGEKNRIAPPNKWAMSGGFVETLVLPQRNELWISQMFRNAIHLFNLKTLEYQNTVNLKGKWPKILSFDFYNQHILTSNWLSRDISIVDVNSLQEIQRIFVDGVPRGLWISPTNKDRYFYAALFGKENDVDQKGQFIKVSLEKQNYGQILLKAGKPGAKRHIIYSNKNKKIYVSEISKSAIEIYNLDGKYLGFINVYNHPNTIAITPDEKYLYVSCRGPNNPQSYLLKGFSMGQINVIDLSLEKVIDSWEGGNQPTGLDISPNGKYIVFSDFLDHAIRVYDRSKLIQ